MLEGRVVAAKAVARSNECPGGGPQVGLLRKRSTVEQCDLAPLPSDLAEETFRRNGTTSGGATPRKMATQVPCGRSETRFGEGPRCPGSRSVFGTRHSALRAFTPCFAPDEFSTRVGKHPISRPLPIHRKAVPTMLTPKPPESKNLVYTTWIPTNVTIIGPAGVIPGGMTEIGHIRNIGSKASLRGISSYCSRSSPAARKPQAPSGAPCGTE
jgi:hypothetical protein